MNMQEGFTRFDNGTILDGLARQLSRSPAARNIGAACVAGCLPIMAATVLALLGKTTFTPTGLLLGLVWTVLPFLFLAAWGVHTTAHEGVDYVSTGTGLVAAAFSWIWITLDSVAYPLLSGHATSSLLWLSPTIATSMIACHFIDRAVSV